jgi:hypothetical protein
VSVVIIFTDIVACDQRSLFLCTNLCCCHQFKPSNPPPHVSFAVHCSALSPQCRREGKDGSRQQPVLVICSADLHFATDNGETEQFSKCLQFHGIERNFLV